jgi:hypothetical protein
VTAHKTKDIGKVRFHMKASKLGPLRGIMASTTGEYQTKIRRPINVTTRFSNEEFALISDAASRANLPLADWFRRTVLDALANQNDDPPQIILHEEIQFIKLILMNMLPKIASGKTVTEEKTMELMLRFKDEKVNLAKQIIQTSQSRGK